MLILYATRKIPGIPTIEILSDLPNEIISKCAVFDGYKAKFALLTIETPYKSLSPIAYAFNTIRIFSSEITVSSEQLPSGWSLCKCFATWGRRDGYAMVESCIHVIEHCCAIIILTLRYMCPMLC